MQEANGGCCAESPRACVPSFPGRACPITIETGAAMVGFFQMGSSSFGGIGKLSPTSTGDRAERRVIGDPTLLKVIYQTRSSGLLGQDQTIDNQKNRYRDDPYYASKEYDMGDIEVPLLSVGNWGGILLHLRGNLEGYVHAGSKFKYLRMITGRHDLPFYYEEEVEIQRSFLDAFLKGEDRVGWSQEGKVAPVSLVLRKATSASIMPRRRKLPSKRGKRMANCTHRVHQILSYIIPGSSP